MPNEMALTTQPPSTGPAPPQHKQATPKRKRGEDDSSIAPAYTTAQFSFRLPPPSSEESGCESPRTRFARQFKGLNIEEQGGGGVIPQQQQMLQMQHPDQHVAFRSLLAGPDEPDNDEDDGSPTTRKRQKLPDVEMHDSATDNCERPVSPSPQRSSTVPNAEPQPQLALKAVTIKDAIAPGFDLSSTADQLHRSYPSINRLQDSKSRQPKRVGTPPPRRTPKKKEHAKKSTEISDSEDEIPAVVDPVRAALTWHEDEITVYDPDDSDDDGVGVNGIGFKPTAAQTRARIAKRKQQLAEYRKREESEARNKRSQRRRGSAAGLPAAVMKNKTASASAVARRVRFMETEAGATALTESAV
ncbi:hypothetical protein BN1723_013232 [Verticillium longisporum]|uniref:Uncharacterized protein n=1 Tax=Verticillium longisporum TaxID=100787 RepID=A0A0G4LQH8_VERLO|nr:hypothetical protein BN1723_013232 [Verticillium longisporum]CRK35799.1 hypothetical protein BN1708_006813 [Verticillium longisporum]